MSGFTITLDAVLALTIAGLLVASTAKLLSETDIGQDEQLVKYGYDFLAAAEKSDALDIVSQGCYKVNETYPCTERFRELIDRLPLSICINTTMRFQDGTFYYHADNVKYATNKCRESDAFAGVSVVSVSRVITRDGMVFPVTLRLWYG